MGIVNRLAPSSRLRLPRRTARLRLTALCGGLFLLSGVALVAITYLLFEQATEYSAVEHLKLAIPPSPFLQGPTRPFLTNTHPLGQAQRDLRSALKDLYAPAIGLGPGAQLTRLQRQLTRVQHRLTEAEHQLSQGQHQLADAVHQLAKAGPAQAAQRAADSHQLLVNSGIALAVVAVLALLAAWLVAGRMLRPIRTITRTARRISSTSLHERLALQGPQDELKELGDTLDELFGRLDAAFEAQRHFVANAAHELRTPLTAERTLLQVALDDPGTTIAGWRTTANEVLASSEEQARLLEALLTLASSEGGLDGNEPIDLAAIVTGALVDLRLEIDELRIGINAQTAPAFLEGDPLLVERLVANLLGNAVRHNVPSGRVEVVTGTTEGRAVLSVTNTGAVIPPAEVGRLFQPFQRLHQRRANYKDGHGLGLSIVQAIASAHHATIAADPLPDGGLAVSIVFPPPVDPPRAAVTSAPSEALRRDRDRDAMTPLH
jgi:signal transduction histidine kinase